MYSTCNSSTYVERLTAPRMCSCVLYLSVFITLQYCPLTPNTLQPQAVVSVAITHILEPPPTSPLLATNFVSPLYLARSGLRVSPSTAHYECVHKQYQSKRNGFDPVFDQGESRLLLLHFHSQCLTRSCRSSIYSNRAPEYDQPMLSTGRKETMLTQSRQPWRMSPSLRMYLRRLVRASKTSSVS
jgi:hypothetical protein